MQTLAFLWFELRTAHRSLGESFNFQSWVQPFIIVTALPCALAGIIWMLFVTGTTLSVPALMGAIMCMGVATSRPG
jgi:multidrug efflux pump subunit AcrB